MKWKLGILRKWRLRDEDGLGSYGTITHPERVTRGNAVMLRNLPDSARLAYISLRCLTLSK
jgi:hypothetical protein